jgi:hypothetical protein
LRSRGLCGFKGNWGSSDGMNEIGRGGGDRTKSGVEEA